MTEPIVVAVCHSIGCRTCQACIDDAGHADTDECHGGFPMRLTRAQADICRAAGHDVRPVIVTDAHLHYLDVLRAAGVVNMMGAGTLLVKRYKVSRKDADAILGFWMNTFAARRERGETIA